MSASQASALTAIAFQLAAALEAYGGDVDRMVGNRMDPELYQKVGRHMDEMRMYAAAFPRLSVSWVELLVRHFELTHGLWRLQQGKLERDEVAQLHEEQRTAARRLRQQCLQLLAADPAAESSSA